MRFVKTDTEGLIYPQASLTGDNGLPSGVLLDTGWDLHWEGPGHVYLSDNDLVDVVVPALERDAVKDALASNGWTAPDGTAAAVAALEDELAAVKAELEASKAVEAGFEAALKKLNAAKPAAKAPAKTPAKTTKE